MSEHEHDYDQERVVLYTAKDDFEEAHEHVGITVFIGSKLPVWEVRTENCDCGGHTLAYLDDTANEHRYFLGMAMGADGPPPPSQLVTMTTRRLQGVLN
jgi:hypothetical protein